MRCVQMVIIFQGKCGHCLNASTQCPGNSEWGDSHRAFGLHLTDLGPSGQRWGEGHPKHREKDERKSKGERGQLGWGSGELTRRAAFCHFLFTLYLTSPIWLLVRELMSSLLMCQTRTTPCSRNWHRRASPLCVQEEKEILPCPFAHLRGGWRGSALLY